MQQRTRRRRLGAQAWRELHGKFAASGLSVQAFCVQEGLSQATFTRWRTRLKSGAVQARPAQPAKPVSAAGAFVELGALRAPGLSSERLELRLDLGGGLVLQLVRG